MDFPGSSYSERLDGTRLEKQHEMIRDLMMDGKWRTFKEIGDRLHYPEASISAQLRHLRKKTYGSYRVFKRRRIMEGLFEYQVLKPLPPEERQGTFL